MMNLPLILVVVRFGWRVLLHFMTPVWFFPFLSIKWHTFDKQMLTLAFCRFTDTRRNTDQLLIKAICRRSCKAEKGNVKIHNDQILLGVLVCFFFLYLHMQRGPTGTVVVVYWWKYSLATTVVVTAYAGRAHWCSVYCMSWVVCRTEVIKITS